MRNWNCELYSMAYSECLKGIECLKETIPRNRGETVLGLPGRGVSPPRSHTASRPEAVGGYFPPGPRPPYILWDLGLTPQSARKLLFQ